MFFLRVLPDDYVIKSIRWQAVDLTKEPLKVTSTSPVAIEIRMARRTEPQSTNVSVRGKVLDNLTNGPSTAERVQLCCLVSGPVERPSTRVRPDGTFSFAELPAGLYTAELRGRSTFNLRDPGIEVGAGATEQTLIASRLLVPLAVYIKVEGAGPTEASSVSLTFKSTGGVAVTGAGPISGAMAVIAVPSGDSYAVAVSNVPVGYAVKSVVAGKSDLQKGAPLVVGQSASSVPEISVTLAPVP